MTVLIPPRSEIGGRRGPRWLSRTTILIADGVFGAALLAIAFAPRLTTPSPSAEVPTQQTVPQAAPVEIAARFGGLNPQAGFGVAADGTLAIVDRGRQVVIRLDANGQPRGEWGPNFGAGLEAKDLVGIAPDGDGWYLLDRSGPRILHLDANGKAQPDRTIDLSRLETYGPNGLATDGHGNLFMADTGRDRVVIFNSSGAMTSAIGDAGSGLGKFKQPMFLAFAPDGSFFVSDWENSRVERFDADHQPTNAWPLPIHAFGIAVDNAGRVYAPDGDHHLVRMFAPDGSLLAQIGADPGSALPVDSAAQVGVSPDGARLWVLGTDALARVDLTPYQGLRGSTSAQTTRTPLAVFGAALLVIAAVGVSWPRVNRLRRARRPSQAAARAFPAIPIRRDLAAVLGMGLFALGGAGALVADMAVNDPVARADPWPRLAWLSAASLVVAIGSTLSAVALPWRWVAPWPGSCVKVVADRFPRGKRALLAVATIAPALVLGGGAAIVWWQGRFQTPEATRAALLWVAALAFAVVSLLSGVRLRRPRLLALVPWILFVLALVPRAWDNAHLPYGVWFDEAEAGLQARRLLASGLYTPITDTYGRDASLFYYLISAAQALISDPVLAGRLVAALVGAACAPLMYLLGKELFGWRVGLAAGLVLVTLRWHLDVSRLGWDPISLPLCAILAFWLLARAIRTGRLSDAIWAGLGIGLGLHAYIGYRALPVVALVLLLYGGWLRRWGLLAYAGRVGAVVGGAVLSALPVIIFAIQDPSGFNGRLNQTLILNEQVSQAQKLDELWSNVQKHALMFHVSGDMNGRHNLPGAPMVDPASGLLMMLGLGVLIARPFDWRAWLVFGWTLVSMAGGIFTFPFEAPQGMRSLGVTPVLALLIGLALVLVLDRLLVLLRTRRRVAAALGAAGAVAVLGWISFENLTIFFARQMNDPIVWDSFSTRETLPSRAALEAPRPYELILGSPIVAPSLQQQLLVPNIQSTIRTFDPSADLPYRGNGPALIVLESEHDAGLADEVSRYYPDAVRQPKSAPNAAKSTAEEIQLDARVIAAHRGLAASSQGDGTWRTDLSVDVPGVYGFRAPGGFSMAVDGFAVADTGLRQLARGNHLITLSGTASAGEAPELSWQPPGADTWQQIEDQRLFSAPAGGNGLQATFYPSADFEGSPTETVIDPILAHYYHNSPFARLNVGPAIWSVEWLGTLDAPTDGTYRFEAERLSRAGLWIDDKLVFDDTADPPNPTQAGSIQLTAGRHQIRVRMQDRGDGGPRMYLYWTAPGGGRELVPGRVLYPPLPTPAD